MKSRNYRKNKIKKYSRKQKKTEKNIKIENLREEEKEITLIKKNTII